MTIYILPVGPNQFPKSYFEGRGISSRPYDGGSPNSLFWEEFQKFCSERGVSLKSYLDWNKGEQQPDDVLLVLNHPGETPLWRSYYYLAYFKGRGGFIIKRRKFFRQNYAFFKRRILMQLEPAVAMPYVYAHFDTIVRSGMYGKIFVTSRLANPGLAYFNYFEHRTRDITSAHFSAPKTKYITMINSNIRPHTLRRELYGERLKSIKFFSRSPDFDLYGFGWDKPPRHPFYLHYAKYVRRTWRGQVPDKLKAMSEYKFALAFENGIYPGWISEKIFDCLAVGAIPVYYGAPDIEKLVPQDCFIDFRKFRNYGKLDAYLRGLSEEEIKGYRDRIARFLKIPPDPKKLENFVEKLLN